ncbi:MAG: hypothetical protein U0W40_03885 [Acidimicrobiia bacterium]
MTAEAETMRETLAWWRGVRHDRGMLANGLELEAIAALRGMAIA